MSINRQYYCNVDVYVVYNFTLLLFCSLYTADLCEVRSLYFFETYSWSFRYFFRWGTALGWLANVYVPPGLFCIAAAIIHCVYFEKFAVKYSCVYLFLSSSVQHGHIATSTSAIICIARVTTKNDFLCFGLLTSKLVLWLVYLNRSIVKFIFFSTYKYIFIMPYFLAEWSHCLYEQSATFPLSRPNRPLKEPA